MFSFPFFKLMFVFIKVHICKKNSFIKLNFSLLNDSNTYLCGLGLKRVKQGEETC